MNCGGATTFATLRGVNDVIKGIVKNDLSISGPKLKKAAEFSPPDRVHVAVDTSTFKVETQQPTRHPLSYCTLGY